MGIRDELPDRWSGMQREWEMINEMINDASLAGPSGPTGPTGPGGSGSDLRIRLIYGGNVGDLAIDVQSPDTLYIVTNRALDAASAAFAIGEGPLFTVSGINTPYVPPDDPITAGGRENGYVHTATPPEYLSEGATLEPFGAIGVVAYGGNPAMFQITIYEDGAGITPAAHGYFPFYDSGIVP